MTDDDRRRALGEAGTELGIGKYADANPDTHRTTDRTANEKPYKPRIDAPEIPGYRITGILGEGGMGTVYAAMQDSPQRKVAIKILHRQSHSAFLRFQTEAAVMARLDHPGIANVFESGEADGHPFLVMDFVEGKTLDEHVAKLGVHTRLELFVAICDAVHHAHVKGVIHRDLKPSNVMVRTDGRAVVLDFGVARLADDNTPGPTRAGELIGTPLYMSPEQARLRPDEVDARSDVYTLGVILYELATNELPYEAPPGLPLPVLTVLICDEPPVPLGKRVPELRGDLEAIAAKALAKEPRDRYQSVTALADDVRRYLDALPVSVRLPGALERTGRFVRRRPWVAASIGAALAAVIVFAAVVTVLWLDARRARRGAEQATARTETARKELETRTTELTLRQARSALTRDPTEALAWLATLPSQAPVDARVAWLIADEARARGVAKDVMRGHADEVHCVEPLATGLVSGSYDGRVIVWDPSPKTVFSADKGRVHLARPSPDGTRIAIGGDDGTFVVVNRDGSGKEVLGKFAGDVQQVAWSPDGKWLAAASDRGNLWLFEHGKGPGRELAFPEMKAGPAATPTAAIDALAFSTTSTHLFAGTEAGDLRGWDLASPKTFGENVGHALVAVWSDGERYMAVDAEGKIYHRSLLSSERRAVVSGVRTKRVAFSPRGGWLVLGGVGGEVVRIDGSSRPVRLHTHRALVRSLAISSDERWLASGGDDGSLVVHDTKTNRELSLHGHAGRIRDVAFGGTTLYSSDSDGTVRRWDLAELGTNVLMTAGPPATTLATDGTRVSAVDESGQLTRWSLATGERVLLERIEGRVTELAVTERGIASGTAEGRLGWHAVTVPSSALDGMSVAATQLGGSARASASVDRGFVFGSSAGPIQFFLPNGRLGYVIGEHRGGTDVLAVSPDRKRLASGGQDRVIRVWAPGSAMLGDIAKLELLAELSGPTGDTHFLAFSPDGSRLVAAGNDGAVFAWNVGITPDAKSLVRLAQHTGAITALAVGTDAVVAAGRDLQLTRILRDGTVERATIATAATTVALGADGTVFAITRGGAALRWERGRDPVVEVDHGVVSAVAIDATRWVLGFADGAVVVVGLGPVSLGDLRARIAALTSYRLR